MAKERKKKKDSSKPKKEKDKKEKKPKQQPTDEVLASKDVAAEAEARPRFSTLDPAVLAYFTEVQDHLKAVEDAEERSLLSANALEETQGESAAAVTSDPTCSRVLETLLDAAPSEAVCKFASAVLANGDFLSLATHPIASHVMERLLTRLGGAAEGDSQEATEEAAQILLEAANGVAGSLYSVVTDKTGSHVARRLLSVAVGRELSPKTPGKSDLAGKVGTVVAHVPFLKPKLPAVLAPIAEAVLADSLADSLAEELVSHPYGSPFLQALLTAERHNGEFLDAFVPRLLGAKQGAEFPASVALERFHGLMQDRTSSHLMEVLLQTPCRARKALQQRFLKGRLAELAQHPIANFVVQALVASVVRAPETKWLVKELHPALPQLLAGRRGGVVAAVVALAVRTGIGYAEIAGSLTKALAGLPEADQGAAGALLALDQGCGLSELPPGRRLSPLGCIILISVLRYPRELALPFVTSVADLAPDVLARIARDPGGSRVLETLLTRSHNVVKSRKKVLKKLAGSWGALADCAAGSFVVERAYTVASMKDKQDIAEALALKSTHLARLPWGAALLNKCGVEEFKRDSERWRARTEKSAAVQAEFEELLGAETAAPARAATEAEEEEEEEADEEPAAASGEAEPEEAGAEPSGTKRAREEELSEAAIFDLFRPPKEPPGSHKAWKRAKRERDAERAAERAAAGGAEGAPQANGGGKALSQRAKTKARLLVVAEKRAAARAEKREAKRAEAEAKRAEAEAAKAAAAAVAADPTRVLPADGGVLEVFEDRAATPKKKKKKQKKQKISKRAGDKTNPLRGGVAKPGKGGKLGTARAAKASRDGKPKPSKADKAKARKAGGRNN